MDKFPIDIGFSIYLLIAVCWTSLFSLTNKRPVRGLRNFGILACYILAIIMLFKLPFLTALLTWCVFGIAAGFLYTLYHFISYARNKSPDKTLEVSFLTFLHGPIAWPIMIPEAIEYSLAELGFLRVTDAKKPSK